MSEPFEFEDVRITPLDDLTGEELVQLNESINKALNPRPVPIPLPPEPPRDRVIEAVDPDGNVSMTWKDNGHFWQEQRHGRYDGDYLWRDIIAEAVDYGWSLRHVPAEGEL